MTCVCGDPSCPVDTATSWASPKTQDAWKKYYQAWSKDPPTLGKLMSIMEKESAPKAEPKKPHWWQLPPKPKPKLEDPIQKIIDRQSKLIDDLYGIVRNQEERYTQLLNTLETKTIEDRSWKDAATGLLRGHAAYLVPLVESREDYKDVLDRLDELAEAVEALEKQ